MISLAAVDSALEGLRRRRRDGVDVQAAPPPAQLPVLAASQGPNLGDALAQVGAAAVGRMGQKGSPAAPTFSTAAESARANTPGFMGGQGAMTKPGTSFINTRALDLESLKPKPKQSLPVLKSPVQTFAQGGTLRRPGEMAVVGDGGEPELLVRGEGGAAHVIPMSAVRDVLERLPVMRDAASQNLPVLRADLQSNAPAPMSLPTMKQQPAAPAENLPRLRSDVGEPPPPVAPPEVTNGLPLSVLDGLKPKPAEAATPPGELRPRSVGGGLKPAEQGGATQTGGVPLSVLDSLRTPERAPGEFEPSRVPMGGKVRSAPAPGEEEANDALVRERIAQAGGFDEGGDAHTRARVEHPREFLEQRIADIEQNPTRQNSNGRWGGALRAGARAARRILASGGNPAQAAGAFAAAFGVGAADTSFDERLGEMDAADRMRGTLAGMNEREAARLKLDGARADVRARNAQANYYEQRPDLEAAKRQDAAAKAERKRIFDVLRSLKGQKLNPSDPRIAQLVADADRAGVPFDVESFNNSKGNVIRYTRTDPQHPERTQVVEWNTVTDEETVLGQKGFQATRGTDGRTTAEVKTDEDRDRAFGATQEYRRQLLSLAGDRFQLALTNGLSAQASREFNVATAGLQQQVNQIRTQIEGWKAKAKAYTVDPAEAERRVKELEAQADPLLERLEASRVAALQKMGGASATGGSAPPATHRMSRSLFRKNNPAYKSASDAEVDEVLKQNGMVGY